MECLCNNSINNPEVIRKAFKMAEMGKPGTAHIELPGRCCKTETDGKPFAKSMVRR